MQAGRIVCYLLSIRNAVPFLLTGGDKTGNDRWYEEFVPIADRLYEEHLVALEKEKKNNG